MNESHRKQAKDPVTMEEHLTKWKPMLQGLTTLEAEFTAHALEQEALYLKPSGAGTGIMLKFMFPIVRRIAPSYATCEMPEFGDLMEHIKREWTLIQDVLLADARAGNLDHIPSQAQVAKVLPGLAERLQGSIKTFKDVPR